MKVHPAVMRSMKSRIDKSMPAGNEGAGVVIDAGANAQDLIGKTVGLAGGSMYAQYKSASAINCDELGLSLQGSDIGFNRLIKEPTINRPGLVLAGFFTYFAFRRIHLFLPELLIFLL